MTAITKDRWLQAQAHEIKHHDQKPTAVARWGCTYENNFRYLGIEKDCKGKTIIEVGCGVYPALRYCHNYNGVIIEPLLNPYTEGIKEKITVIRKPLEEAELPKADEVWLFNVMQHIIDPDLFVQKCKEAASVIRYFEPVDYPESLVHPHSFTIADFKHWFTDAKFYNERHIPNFHDGPCAYGVWVKDIRVPHLAGDTMNALINDYQKKETKLFIKSL